MPANSAIDWHVLFVGSDPLWFRQVVQDIRCLQPNWLCQLAENSVEAEQALAKHSFNAIIVEGARLEHNDLKRILLTNDHEMVGLARCNLFEHVAAARWQALGATPVADDSDAATLVAGLKRADQLRGWMSNPAIKKIMPQLKILPTAPDLYTRVSEELKSSNGSMAEVARLISQDPVILAKILQVVNSAYFGLPREVTDASEAVMIMGAERVRSLILLSGVFSQYNASACPDFSVESVWGHSVQVGLFARTITFSELKDARAAEAAFTAGLLHDIGKLILAGNLPQMYAIVRRLQASKKIKAIEAEMMGLGVTLAELGACLLGTWRMPLPILEAIAWHQQPQRAKETSFSLLTAVHAANVLAGEGPKGENPSGDVMDEPYLLRIGITDGGNSWRELCGVENVAEPATGREVKRSENMASSR